MNIDPKLAKAFNQAVTNLDNIHTGRMKDVNNWNFVDADCYCAKTEAGESLGTVLGHSYMPQFDYLADCYTGEITLADRIAEAEHEVALAQFRSVNRIYQANQA